MNDETNDQQDVHRQLPAATASVTAGGFFFLIPRRLSDGYSQRNERL